MRTAGFHTFYVDISEVSVPDAPSDVPVTILFKDGQKLDTAEEGDIPKFYDLLGQAERGY